MKQNYEHLQFQSVRHTLFSKYGKFVGVCAQKKGAGIDYHEQLKNDRDIDGSDAYFVEVKRGIEDITGDVTG